ncbi:hypothetical protein ASG78_12245 [Nostocoides sp. Soil756]|nr:hypothetical protein ASG78_12245 [Tetrasphaera sp. Soil756]
MVREARVPVSASSTALATSMGRTWSRLATVAASTQPRPGRWVPETANPGLTWAMGTGVRSGSSLVVVVWNRRCASGGRSAKRVSSPV